MKFIMKTCVPLLLSLLLIFLVILCFVFSVTGQLAKDPTEL